MQLTGEQKHVVEEWVRQKIEHPTCQLCQASQWRIGELILAPDRAPADMTTGAMAQVICQNCGHVLLFDVSTIEQWRAVESTSDLM